MTTSDEALVREALKFGLDLWNDEPDVFYNAIDAFERVMSQYKKYGCGSPMALSEELEKTKSRGSDNFMSPKGIITSQAAYDKFHECPKSDEDLVREAIEHWIGLEKIANCGQSYYSTVALAAFDRLLERTLPELPEGWFITSMHNHCSNHNHNLWFCAIRKDGDTGTNFPYLDGTGPTPRLAVLNALENVR